MTTPRIELLSTGDELLNGSIVDTNSPWLMERLVALSLPVWRKTIVGDDKRVLIEAFRESAARSAVVVVSGGLGPTSDDLTAEAAAEAAGVELHFDAETYAAIEARFRQLNRTPSPNNRRQAMVPDGATVIPNRFGTAPMLALTLGAARFFFLPGVPREFMGLVDEKLLPALADLAASTVPRRMKTLRCYGLAESALDQKLADLPATFPGLTLGYRTTLPENHAKLVVVGPEADEVLHAATREARDRLGADCFGEDRETFSEVVGVALRRAHGTVALAESLTAGRASALLAETAGASDYLVGGFVTYDDGSKHQLLGVAEELLAREGAVSGAVAEAMAQGARERTGATYGIACTGVAGPESDGRHPVGTVFTALASADGVTFRQHLFRGDRDQIREFSAYAALDALRRSI